MSQSSDPRDPTYRRSQSTAPGDHDAKVVSSASPTANTPQDGAAARLRGIVGGFRERTENDGAWTIWSFRLDRHDERGNRLPPVPVEMTGTSFTGLVQDGDEVDVEGEWDEEGILRSDRLLNRTMSETTVVAHHARFVRSAKRVQSGVLDAAGGVLEGDRPRGLKWFLLLFAFLLLGLPAIVFVGYLIVMWLIASRF